MALWQAYRMRLRRRKLLLRALRKRREIKRVVWRADQVRPDDILLFATVRNENLRLPYFLEHYRKLGVDSFFIVDNGSDDGTVAYLSEQPDVSLWQSKASYKRSRFGMDWLNLLLFRYGNGHWCVTVDADELLIYPHHETRPLPALTGWLEAQNRASFGALMLDLYPRGPVADASYQPGQNPTDVLNWFDSGNYTYTYKPDLKNIWIQGGVRARQFFYEDPRRAPTLGKVPLIKWNWRYTYVSSTHSALPVGLNQTYAEDGGEMTSGVLLHTKFLNIAPKHAEIEKQRGEHFANSVLYDRYYDDVASNPDLWCRYSTPLQNWRQLEAMGLMSKGGWP